MRRALIVAVSFVLLVPVTVAAQSSIAGRVTDNTGGALPGVTVQAASPALIEGTRVAISDGNGRYEIVDLRPGLYTVTYTLSGFNTHVREEIQLPADFLMTLNIVMSVGAIEETVTVTGQSPIVDVQNVRHTEVMTREFQEEIPTGRALWSYAALMPGVRIGRPDVGGTSGHQQVGIGGAGAVGFQRDSVYEIDGLDISMYIGDNWMPYLNPMLLAETSYTTAGIGAETQRGGMRMNMIPKDGGNRFSGSFFAGGSLSPAWQADNWTERLGYLGVQSKDRGDLRDGIPQIDRLYDLNVEVGGPIFKDRLWFHTSSRRLVVNNQVLNSTTRDGSPGLDTNSLTDGALRLTWQASVRNKVAVGFDKLRKRRFTQHVAGEDVQTASTYWTSPHYDTGTAKWTSTINNRLLAEFGASLSYQDWDPSYQDGIRRDRPSAFVPCFATPCFPSVGSPEALVQRDRDGWYGVTQRVDPWLGLNYGAAANETENYPHAWSYKGALTYVTGSHNVKVGFQNKWGNQRRNRNNNAHLIQLYDSSPSPWGHQLSFVGADHFAAGANLARGLPPGLIGTPNQVTVYNNPVNARGDVDYDIGIFAQDSWTMNRLTLNLGVRMDVARPSVPESPNLLGRFKPQSTLPAVELPRFGPDVSPRLSLAYDLFGNARTALKFGWNRYVSIVADTNFNRYATAFFDSDARSWFDLALDPATGREYPGCTLTNVSACPNPYGTNGDDIAQDWEIGPSGNVNFGRSPTRTIDPNIQRPYNDQWMAEVQHEVIQGVSVAATYRRRTDKDLFIGTGCSGGLTAGCFAGLLAGQSGDNVRRSFDSFTSRVEVARPAPYLGSFTIFNIDPAQRAALAVLDANAAPGSYSLVYKEFGLSVSARLPRGGRLIGGWGFSKVAMDSCQDERNRGDDPNRLRFCNDNAYPIPYIHELKLTGSLPFSLPWVGDFNTGFAILGVPGDGFPETFRYSRSTAASAETQYRAPFYTGGTCVAPCVPNGRMVDPNRYTTVGTSPTFFDAVLLPEDSVKFFPRLTQMDVNIAKVFRLGNWRYDVRLEAFNVLNNSADRGHSATRGTSAGLQTPLFERASLLIDARVLRFAVTARF
ncbi:MAG: carboxypeptidase regulatory-like domain-containing protein [Acidobacteriota bacterium]